MWTAVYIPLMIMAICGWLLAWNLDKTANHRTHSLLRSIPLTFCWNNCIQIQLPPNRLLEAVAAVSGLLTSLGFSGCLTQVGKATFQRRRPNFYEMCQFDYETQQCLASNSQVCGAQYSFPSGQASMEGCAMMYLCCFFCGKIVSSSGNQRYKPLWCFLTCSGFLSWAVFVAVTRVTDHWHNPGDVAAGLLLGGGTALTVYHIYYPPLWNSTIAGTPHTIVPFLREEDKSNDTKVNSKKQEMMATPQESANVEAKQALANPATIV